MVGSCLACNRPEPRAWQCIRCQIVFRDKPKTRQVTYPNTDREIIYWFPLMILPRDRRQVWEVYLFWRVLYRLCKISFCTVDTAMAIVRMDKLEVEFLCIIFFTYFPFIHLGSALQNKLQWRAIVLYIARLVEDLISMLRITDRVN